jgi:N6-adenosine-specific RNA methylase IME4
MKFHELAGLFPLMQGAEFNSLVKDIKENGLIEDIILYEDKILDGRNRYNACIAAGVEPRYQSPQIHNPLSFVLSENLERRHLTSDQRAACAVSALEYERERARKRMLTGDPSQKIAEGRAAEIVAKQFKTNRTYVSQLDKLSKESPGKFEAVRSGDISLQEVVRESRHTERIENLKEISKANPEMNLTQRYPIIYADPPWRYENPPIGASNRAIENHYPTMTLKEISELPVQAIATQDALLYLWATAPKLAECMEVISAWGFDYRTCFVWVKDKIGMGYHARNQHEILLIAKRGSIPPPPVTSRVSSVVMAPRTTHSTKPRKFYEIIENAYPDLPKIELFARGKRSGWDVWGNQSNVT